MGALTVGADGSLGIEILGLGQIDLATGARRNRPDPAIYYEEWDLLWLDGEHEMIVAKFRKAAG